MKLRTILPFAIVVATSAAVAQTAPAPSTAPSTPAPAAPPAAPSASPPSTTGTTAPRESAPVAGANSFTEAQAKSRIEQHGFSSVGGLMKDEKGIWRGKAMKDGKSVSVMLDYRGNVVSQ